MDHLTSLWWGQSRDLLRLRVHWTGMLSPLQLAAHHGWSACTRQSWGAEMSIDFLGRRQVPFVRASLGGTCATVIQPAIPALPGDTVPAQPVQLEGIASTVA